MNRITSAVIAFFIFNTSLHAQLTTTVDPLAPGENIYKHFTGTIGNRTGVIDLRYGYQGAANYGGSTCYFTDEGGLSFFLVSQPPTFAHTEIFRAQVFPENIPLSAVKDAYSIFVQTQRYEFTVSHDTLRGRLFIPNTQDPQVIFMTENYTNALRMDFVYAADSLAATNKKNEPIRASVTYSGVQVSPKMKPKERLFINEAFAQFMSGGKVKVSEQTDLSQICIQAFFTDFKATLRAGNEIDGTNLTGKYTLFPVYNDNGLLVLQKGGYQYDFEHKDYTDRNMYLCLDITNKKTLLLSDVIDVNKEVLTPLLEKAFRKKYQLDAGKKLSDLFMSDKMPVTDNYIITNTGLIFSYSPVKIFHDNEDISELQEMRIFLPYDELGSMVKPEFKKRMGIK